MPKPLPPLIPSPLVKMSPSDQPPVLVLITGAARAGKDTLADGLIAGANGPIHRIRFADPLKDAADDFLACLGLDRHGSFLNEGFKSKHRDFLVSAGTFARSLDVDVFAYLMVQRAQAFALGTSMAGLRPVVVVSDWRYLNEWRIVKSVLGIAGWRIVTVEVCTAGVQAANDEEARSLGAIRREVIPDLSFNFTPDSAAAVRREGIELARTLAI